MELSWKVKSDEFLEDGTAETTHGRYNWIEEAVGVSLYYDSKGIFFGMPSEPQLARLAKTGKHLGNFGTREETIAAAEANHESKKG